VKNFVHDEVQVGLHLLGRGIDGVIALLGDGERQGYSWFVTGRNNSGWKTRGDGSSIQGDQSEEAPTPQ